MLQGLKPQIPRRDSRDSALGLEVELQLILAVLHLRVHRLQLLLLGEELLGFLAGHLSVHCSGSGLGCDGEAGAAES